jgi:hypothetical protein
MWSRSRRSTSQLRRTGMSCLPWLVPVVVVALADPAEAQSEADVDSVLVSGMIVPSGPPQGAPVRMDAGGSCIVDVTQRYDVAGSIRGSLEVDFRILVHGPCGSPPGTFDEEWIALGELRGRWEGGSISTRLAYKAEVRGGAVEGNIVLGPGASGQLKIRGTFAEGRLAYTGWVRAPRD